MSKNYSWRDLFIGAQVEDLEEKNRQVSAIVKKICLGA
jgi:hypothetical protein